MSLLLGIYSKNKTIDNAFIKGLLNVFSLDGKRPLKTITTGSLVLVLSDNNNNFYSNDDFAATLSGRLYSISNMQSQPLTISQNPCLDIIKSFIEKGTFVFENFEGEYTCVIADKKQDKIFIANDYWGLYPFYYTDADDYFAFCNEYEPLTSLPNLKTDNNALVEYFSLGAVLGEKTFFENIKSIPSNSFIELTNSKITISTQRKKDITVNKIITINEAVEHISFLFNEGLQKRLNYFQYNFDAMLTGGADTRLILSCINNEQRHKIKFVSYLTPPLTAETDADVVIAHKIASSLNLNHEVRQFELWDEPFDENYFRYKRTISEQKYLSGHFGSELLKKEIYKATDTHLLKAISASDTFFSKIKYRFDAKKELRYIFSEDILKGINNPFETLKTEIDKHNFCENKKLLFLFNIMTRSFFTRTWRGTQSIYFDQPAYMPIVFIMPFLDKNLLTFIFSLPENFFGVNHDNIYNLLFKNHFPELLSIATNSPLANDPLSAFKKETTLSDPFDLRNYNYKEIMSKLLLDKDSLLKYNKKFIQTLNNTDDRAYRQSFIDYETWNRYIRTR